MPGPEGAAGELWVKHTFRPPEQVVSYPLPPNTHVCRPLLADRIKVMGLERTKGTKNGSRMNGVVTGINGGLVTHTANRKGGLNRWTVSWY